MPRPIPVEEMVRQFKEHHQNSHILRIDNFFLLKKYQLTVVESSTLDIGGYKWKLLLYPNGGGPYTDRHISICLGRQDYGSLPSDWQVKIKLQFFVLNQFRKDWCLRQDTMVYNASNPSWGYPDLISLVEFGDPTRGYLVDDCALFGVKILDIKATTAGTAECFRLIENPPDNKFSWKILKFSVIDRLAQQLSEEFVIGNRKWRMQVYPQGSATSTDDFAMYLRGESSVGNVSDAKIWTRFTLKVFDQIKSGHITNTYSYKFPADPSGYGLTRFMPLKDLRNSSNYVVDDVVYVGVEVHAISMLNFC